MNTQYQVKVLVEDNARKYLIMGPNGIHSVWGSYSEAKTVSKDLNRFVKLI